MLFIGPTGSGKSSLLKQLKNLSTNTKEDSDLPPTTIPTVGTNMITLPIGKKSLQIREIGGSMASIWSDFYQDCPSLVYVIDMANPYQLSCTTIELLNLLKHQVLQSTSILIALNKMDVPFHLEYIDLVNIMDLNTILKNAHQKIKIVETSAVSKQGLNELLTWLKG